MLAETERALRAVDYLHDARVRPFAYDGKNVDVFVETRDVWSLQPGIAFSRKGGANEASVEIEEENLFGRGKDVSISWSDEVERGIDPAALARLKRDAESLALGARLLDQRRRSLAPRQPGATVFCARHALERRRLGVRLARRRSQI